MTERLRWKGEGHSDPTTFMGHGVGEVQPGGEFDVPDGAAEPYLRRSDIERVEVDPPTDAVDPPTDAAASESESVAEPEPPAGKAVRKPAVKVPPPPEGEVLPEQ